MGLINEVNSINQELKTQNTEKEQKRLEKIKKEFEAKEKKRIEQQTSDFLKTEFERYFQEYGSTYETEFLSIARKNKILESCKKDILRPYNDPKFPNGAFYKDTESKILIDHFNKIYYKLLKEQKAIYLNNEKYLAIKEQREAEQQQEQPETKIHLNVWEIVENTFKILFKIAVGIFAALAMLIVAALKSVK